MTQEDKNTTKCYCGHTTYCDCDPLEEPKDNNHSVEANEMIDHIGDANKMVEISEDQAIEMVKDMNKQPMRFHCVPKEISDEEIMEYATKNAFQYYEFVSGAKWYREQLRLKANNNT